MDRDRMMLAIGIQDAAPVSPSFQHLSFELADKMRQSFASEESWSRAE